MLMDVDLSMELKEAVRDVVFQILIISVQYEELH